MKNKLALTIILLFISVLSVFSQDKIAFDFQTKGNEFLKQENYIEALKFYNRAIDIYSTKTDIENKNMLGKSLFYRANCKQSLEDYRGAINDYDKLIEVLGKLKSNIDNFYNSSFYYRGICKLLVNNKEGACQDWSKAGELGEVNAYDKIKQYCIDFLNEK